MATADDISL